MTMLVLRLELGDLGVNLFHVEPLDGLQDLLESRRRQGAGLVEDQYALAEGHQGRNALDAEWPVSSWLASVSSLAKTIPLYSSDAFS